MNIDLFEIIRTTRSMRRLKPDPVPPTLIRQILEAGTSAANGGNMQTWRFLVIRDPAIKAAVAQWYRRGWHEIVGPRYRSSAPAPGSSRERFDRMLGAAEHLADHLHEAPVWIVPCLQGGTPYQDLWLLDLSRCPEYVAGCSGTRAWCHINNAYLLFEKDAEAALGLPEDAHSYAILPIGYPLGKFGPVARTSLRDVVFSDRWGEEWTDG